MWTGSAACAAREPLHPLTLASVSPLIEGVRLQNAAKGRRDPARPALRGVVEAAARKAQEERSRPPPRYPETA